MLVLCQETLLNRFGNISSLGYRLHFKHFSLNLRIFRNSHYRFRKQKRTKINVSLVTTVNKLISYTLIKV